MKSALFAACGSGKMVRIALLNPLTKSHLAGIRPGSGLPLNLRCSGKPSNVCASTTPPAAFVAGILGLLIGSDPLHLKQFVKIAPAMASTGGAGTFDGIVLIRLHNGPARLETEGRDVFRPIADGRA